MEYTANYLDLSSADAKVAEMRRGANWFFWVAILGAVSALVYFFFNFSDHLVQFGMGLYADRQAIGTDSLARIGALLVNLGVAGLFAWFGYMARKGSDIAFIVGMFLYVFDAVILLGYREFFAFSFHAFALFFIAKGLLASRRRYDPSVDATGA